MKVDFSKNLYLSVTGNRLLAGPGVLTAIKFISDRCPGPLPNRGIRNQYIAIQSYLDTLEENKDYLIKSVKILNTEIEYKGFYSAASKRVLDLTAELSYKWNCNSFLLCSSESVGNLYFKYDKADNTDWRKDYCDKYSKYYQMYWMVEYYHSFYPSYKFDKNYGWATKQHLDKVLEIGLINNLHRIDSLHLVAKRWLELVRKNDLWALTKGVYYRRNPDWWPKKTVGCNLIDYLNSNEKEEVINRFVKHLYRHESDWVLKDLREDLPNTKTLLHCGTKEDLENFLDSEITYKRGRYKIL